MITGDQAGTALHVAKDVGIYDERATRAVTGRQIDLCQKAGQIEELLDVKVFARVSPQHKLDIIQMHQDDGSVVAMTGDGVNDAPALKRADIGVAMGIRGTEVARESADMVLRDDAFTSIVAAVAQGRVIFNNIRKFVVYLLSCNLSEIMVIGVASAMDAPLPLLPLQILFLNMVTDVFPALALGTCQGHEDVMTRPPRSVLDSIVGKQQWWVIMLYSTLITAVVLCSFTIARGVLGMSSEESLTVSFLVIALAQILHVFNMAEPGSHPFKNEITKNGYVWAAVVLCGLILYLAVSFPPLARVLTLQSPSASGFVLIVVASAVPLIVGRFVSMIKR
jgi:Ca2+-transporting ATPase